jgi:hypothetical protein
VLSTLHMAVGLNNTNVWSPEILEKLFKAMKTVPLQLNNCQLSIPLNKNH